MNSFSHQEVSQMLEITAIFQTTIMLNQVINSQLIGDLLLRIIINKVGVQINRIGMFLP